MKYVIKVSYSMRLEYKDYEEFTAALGTLIAGGLREIEILVEEVQS